MANLNLSQFGEKLFVADADHTFIWDTAASISKRVSRNSWLNSGTLTADAPVTISQTWNNAAVAFTGLKVNAVSTASADASRLLDLQLGGVSKLSVTKAGTINFGEVQANFDPYISRVAIGTLAVSLYGFNQNHVSLGYAGGGNSLPGVTISSNGQFAWSSSATNSEATRDTILLRDGEANHLALRNATNGQKFSVYGTYPGAAWERFTITAPTSGNVLLGTYKGTGGIARGLEVQIDGTSRWLYNTSGHLLAAADNAYDIGASGANRPRNVYVGSGLAAGSTVDAPYIRAGSAGGLQMQGRFFISSTVDGNIYLTNNSLNDFGRLQFGGTSASFPAIKRNTTTIQARLADDSAFTNIQGKLTTDTAFTSGAITDTGYIVLYDSTGTAYKVACTPA